MYFFLSRGRRAILAPVTYPLRSGVSSAFLDSLLSPLDALYAEQLLFECQPSVEDFSTIYSSSLASTSLDLALSFYGGLCELASSRAKAH